MHYTPLAIKKNKIREQAGILVGLFFLGLTLGACDSSDPVVAEVEDAQLRESDIYLIMQHSDLDQDDAQARQRLIEEWAEKQLYIEELKRQYPDQWQLIDLRAKSFAGDLSRYYLEDATLRKKLDTIVSDQDVTAYYNEHADEFVLQDYLVRGLYLKIPKDADFKSHKINQYYLLKNDKDIVQVDSYAKLYAQNYYYNDSSWIYFNELVKDVPLKKYNRDNIVLNRTKTYFSDEEYTYFINIIDYKLKDEVPPIDFLRNEIREIIIAHRLQDLKEKNELNYIEKLKDKHEVNIYQ